MTGEAEVLSGMYAALSRGDIPAALKDFDRQIVRIEFEGSPSGGVYRGLADVEPHFVKGRSTWAEGACSPEDFIAAGDKVVVPVYVRVRLRDKTDWLEGRVADVFTFRGGKIIEFRTFEKKEDALAFAGVKA